VTLQLPEALQVLARTPAALSGLLAGTSPIWHAVGEGPDTWSPRDVVGHLIYTDESVWLARAATVREHGESRSFQPGDSSGHLSLVAGRTIEALLERFAATREASLATVRGWSLTEDDLQLRGRHSKFGAVTLGQLLAAWAVHDLNHVAQIVRVMARQYTDEVGVWRDYMSILEWRAWGRTGER
jgi:hypothetical protein